MKHVHLIANLTTLFVLILAWDRIFVNQQIMQDCYYLGRLLIVLAFWVTEVYILKGDHYDHH